MTRIASLLVAAALLTPAAAQAAPSPEAICAYAESVADEHDDEDGLLEEALDLCDERDAIGAEVAAMEDRMNRAEEHWAALGEKEKETRRDLAAAKVAFQDDRTKKNFYRVIGLQRRLNELRAYQAELESAVSEVIEALEAAYAHLDSLESALRRLPRVDAPQESPKGKSHRTR